MCWCYQWHYHNQKVRREHNSWGARSLGGLNNLFSKEVLRKKNIIKRVRESTRIILYSSYSQYYLSDKLRHSPVCVERNRGRWKKTFFCQLQLPGKKTASHLSNCCRKVRFSWKKLCPIFQNTMDIRKEKCWIDYFYEIVFY